MYLTCGGFAAQIGNPADLSPGGRREIVSATLFAKGDHHA
jgi:hypothetical protein